MKVLLRVYQESVNSARQKFTPGELSMMLDVMNSTYVDAISVGHGLTANIRDAFALDPGMYEEKWDIKDPKAMVEKLNGLPPFHLSCLEIWANSYWYGDEFSETPDLKEYITGKVPVIAPLRAVSQTLLDCVENIKKARDASGFKGKSIESALEEAKKAREILEGLM